MGIYTEREREREREREGFRRMRVQDWELSLGCGLRAWGLGFRNLTGLMTPIVL